MTAHTFIEAIKAKRAAHLEALARSPDNDHLGHVRIKGVMQGLDDAAAMFREHMRKDSEE